jgi:hypothetical protein
MKGDNLTSDEKMCQNINNILEQTREELHAITVNLESTNKQIYSLYRVLKGLLDTYEQPPDDKKLLTIAISSLEVATKRTGSDRNVPIKAAKKALEMMISFNWRIKGNYT